MFVTYAIAQIKSMRMVEDTKLVGSDENNANFVLCRPKLGLLFGISL